MRVEFVKVEKNGRRACYWEAVRGKRTRVPGSYMAAGAGLPHDLAQYVIEAATGCDTGFWGLVARGATFKSTGRKRTKPGRELIADNRDALAAAEDLAGRHLALWQRGDTSHVAAALQTVLEQWQALGERDRLVFDWPSPSGHFEMRTASA